MSLAIAYSAQAREDLRGIVRHISSEAGARVAERMADRIIEAVEGLADHPEIGVADDRLGSRRRRLVVRPYLAVYAVDGDRIDVIRIVHGARDLPALFGA